MTLPRWDRCVRHDEDNVPAFLAAYLADESRNAVFIAAAGFDPRSMLFARLIAAAAGKRTAAVALREERPSASTDLLNQGDVHEAEFKSLFAQSTTLRFPIFAAEDLAVVGGRKFVAELNRYDLSGVTDVFLDVSAMSVGIYFPVFCLLLQQTEKLHINFHLLLTSNPDYDRLAVPTYTDRIDSPHGMSFEADVLGERRSPNEGRLWLPQLRIGTNQECARIFDAIGPDDVCPILPFPSRDPRTADLTAMAFASEFDLWDVDPRSILLASDSNPLDVYRSIIRLSEARLPVFGETLSNIVLTPMGAKATAVGMLLAAYELHLPVVTSEVLSYSWANEQLPAAERLVHLWINSPVT